MEEGKSGVPSARWQASQTLSKLNYILVGDYEFGHQTKRYIALSFLIIAVLIGFGSYTQTGIFRNSVVSYRPDFYSGFLAIGFVAALHVRRLIPVSLSVYFLLSFSLNTAVTAIIIQGLLGTGVVFGLVMKTAIPAALLMTWLGIRAFAPIMWLLVVVLGSFNLGSMSNAMGVWGFGFLLLTVIGILMQIEGNVSSMKENILYDLTGKLPERLVPLALSSAVVKNSGSDAS